MAYKLPNSIKKQIHDKIIKKEVIDIEKIEGVVPEINTNISSYKIPTDL